MAMLSLETHLLSLMINKLSASDEGKVSRYHTIFPFCSAINLRFADVTAVGGLDFVVDVDRSH